jgi:hypothetical protein
LGIFNVRISRTYGTEKPFLDFSTHQLFLTEQKNVDTARDGIQAICTRFWKVILQRNLPVFRHAGITSIVAFYPHDVFCAVGTVYR